VTLWRSDATGLRVCSEMHDIERIEVGVLHFSFVATPSDDETYVDVSSAFHHELTVSKLVMHESGTSAESGLMLVSGNGEHIVVIAAASPYHIAAYGLSDSTDAIASEYPLDRYVRAPIT
jgi:hypothetical protein